MATTDLAPRTQRITHAQPLLVIPAPLAEPWPKGTPVMVSKGGYQGETGRVRRSEMSDAGHWYYAIDLDNGRMFYGNHSGPRPCLVAK